MTIEKVWRHKGQNEEGRLHYMVRYGDNCRHLIEPDDTAWGRILSTMVPS